MLHRCAGHFLEVVAGVLLGCRGMAMFHGICRNDMQDLRISWFSSGIPGHRDVGS